MTRQQRYYAKNKADPTFALKRRAATASWKKRNREKVSASAKKARLANPRKFHERDILATYGLAPEGRAALLKAQGGRCAICRQPPFKKRLSVDHDHTTGRVRGLLCPKCNHALGLFLDSPLILTAAIRYLEIA